MNRKNLFKLSILCQWSGKNKIYDYKKMFQTKDGETRWPATFTACCCADIFIQSARQRRPVKNTNDELKNK